jgi:hypothetical protein
MGGLGISLPSPLMLKFAKDIPDHADFLPFLTDEAFVFSIQGHFSPESPSISMASASDDFRLDEWLAFDTDSSPCDSENDAASTPVSQASPAQLEHPVTPERLISPPSPAVGRGSRLSKKSSQTRGARGHTNRLDLNFRRKVSNYFGRRRRRRLRDRVDELWKVIPREEKELRLGAESSVDGSVLCRADRLVIVVAYIRKLQKQLDGLTDGRTRGE